MYRRATGVVRLTFFQAAGDCYNAHMSPRLRYLYRAYRYRWRVDPAEIRFLRDRLRPGQTAVDAGSFKGAYTYWMRRSVGSGGAVVAFEPQPQQAAYLRDVFSAMHYDNVTLVPMGLSNRHGNLKLFVPETAGGASHGATFVVGAGASEAGASIDVTVTTLDAYFADRRLACDFIKVDVEGHELAVLEGAHAVLIAHRPTILIECEARHRADGDVRPVFNFLASLGYEGSFFIGRRQRPLAGFDAALHQRCEPGTKLPPDYVNNFAFEHPDRSTNVR
jgi:FkbM family methyltransferase